MTMSRDHLPDLERLPGAAGIKVFMEAPRPGKLLVADDAGVLMAILKADPPPGRLPQRGRGSASGAVAFGRSRRAGIESGVARRDRRPALYGAAGAELAREARAQVHVLHISTLEETAFLEGAKDVASCEATPHHLTLSVDDDYAPARDEAADESAACGGSRTARGSGGASRRG